MKILLGTIASGVPLMLPRTHTMAGYQVAAVMQRRQYRQGITHPSRQPSAICLGTSRCYASNLPEQQQLQPLRSFCKELEIKGAGQEQAMATHGCGASTPEDVPGGAKTLTSKVIGAGAGVLQKLKPIQAFQQHICTWAIFSHDMNRKIETHHHAARLNEDFMQCAVYDSDQSNARLIGVEYVISEKVFKTLPKEEKQLWHSHEFEIKEGLWVNPGVPEMIQKQELKSLANTYGKFWCTWQFDRGDVLPLGAPALMMSPQKQEPGRIPDATVAKRDARFGIASSSLKESRADIRGVERVDPDADRWRHTGKGWAVELVDVLMALG